LTSEVVDNFLKDFEYLLPEKDAGDLDNSVFVLVVVLVIFVVSIIVVVIVVFVVSIVVVAIVVFVVFVAIHIFLLRKGSKGENGTFDRGFCHANRIQARISSKRIGSNRGGRSKGTGKPAALNLCCQIPGKDWIHSPLGIMETIARVVVQVVVVTVWTRLDIAQSSIKT
jgi:hypothetical protein